jgi:uncharacterized membrane protein YesL
MSEKKLSWQRCWQIWKDALAASATVVTIGLSVGLCCGVDATWLSRWANRIPVIALSAFIITIVAALCIHFLSTPPNHKGKVTKR